MNCTTKSQKLCAHILCANGALFGGYCSEHQSERAESAEALAASLKVSFDDCEARNNALEDAAKRLEATCEQAMLQLENITESELCARLIAERDELSAKATEYDRIKDLVDPNGEGNLYDQIVNMLHDNSSERYWQTTAEQERSNAAAQRERAETLRATVAEQARKLEEACASLLKIHDQSYRASLVQNRSVGLIKQVCISISIDAKDAAVQAQRKIEAQAQA